MKSVHDSLSNSQGIKPRLDSHASSQSQFHNRTFFIMPRLLKDLQLKTWGHASAMLTEECQG